MNAQAPQSLLGRLWAEDADEPQWITVNGAHIPLNKEGEPKGKVGEKIKESASADTPFGEAFPEYSGKAAEAIEHLLKVKTGHVPGAFQKEGLGDIDLPYGKGGERGFGLAHIIEQRNAQGIDGVAFVRGLPKLIAEGKVERRPDHPGRAYIVHNGQEAVVRLDWDGKDRKWLITAYYQERGSGGHGKFSQDSCLRKPDLAPLVPAWELNPTDEKIIPSFSAVNIEEAKPMNDTLTLDAAPSRRHRDENGFLHVDACHITREQVAPYCGYEIPGWEALGLDPEKLYHAYRPADELEKAAPTINGLPILWGHSPESADAPQLDRRIGSMGTDAAFHAPYLDNSLIFTVAEAIDAIEDGRERELSLSYRYEPDFTPGSFEGQPYDFVMRNLRGNHLALVPEGRAGASCCVADAAPDAAPNPNPLKGGLMSKFKKLFRGANDADPENTETQAPEGQSAPEAPQAEPAPEGNPEGKDKGMDEGMKAAMDKCGLDAEDPAAQAAFAEGVKYGEALMREKGEREKLDSEHEAEGMEKAEDEEASAASAAPAVDEEKVAQTASDAALRKFQSILDAQAEVRPHVGEMRVNLAQDSAATIYGAALDALGIDRKGTPPAAWRGMFRTAVNLQRRDNSRAMAQDAAPVKGPLAGLNNISSL